MLQRKAIRIGDNTNLYRYHTTVLFAKYKCLKCIDIAKMITYHQAQNNMYSTRNIQIVLKEN